MIAKTAGTTEHRKIQLHAWLYMLFFLIAPLEDKLTGPIGTVAKYIAILIVLVALAESRGNLIFRLNIMNVCVLLLMLLSFFSVIWAMDQEQTMSHITVYLLLPGLCLFTSLLDFTEREFDWITAASILGGLITAAIILLSGTTLNAAGRRSLGEGNDPNNMAAQLLLPAALAWGRLQQKPGWRKLPYILAFAFLAFSMLSTGSRGGFVGLIVMVLAYLLSSGVFKKPSVIVLTVLLAAALIYFLPQLLPEGLRNRMFEVDNYTGTGADRRDLWKATIREILPNMQLIGYGAGSAPLKMQEVIGYYKGVHNTYLTMLVEYGILGLPVFLTMIVAFVVQKIKTKYFAGAAALIGICVVIFFLDSYGKKFFWNIIMLLIVHGQVLLNRPASEAAPAPGTVERLPAKRRLINRRTT